MQKAIRLLLDFLLILGALVSIFTIDGGKWLINNPAFYQPGLEEWNSTVPLASENIIPVTAASEKALQADPACLKKPQSYITDWENTAVMLNAFHNAMAVQADRSGQACN